MTPASRKGGSDCACVSVFSPVSGEVLRILTESEGVVQSGTPLMEVGDPNKLEIVVDLLSADAVRVQPGQRAVIEAWGGPRPLEGTVRRVEPFGFTKVSALGIEEQRVNVVIDIKEPRTEWQRLGHGYRVEPRIVLWEARDVLKVPLSALFRQGTQWAVFVDKGGRADLRSSRGGTRERARGRGHVRSRSRRADRAAPRRSRHAGRETAGPGRGLAISRSLVAA